MKKWTWAVIAQEPVKIALNDVRPVMEQKLTALGFEMVKRLVTDLAQDRQPDLKEQTMRVQPMPAS
jgi:hypothetical protein